MTDRIKKSAAEALGLFVIMFCGCGTAMLGVDLGAIGIALAFGLSLAAMMSVFGPVSGGHFNPAVSLAMFIKGKLNTIDFLFYLGGQLVGSFAAAGLLLLLDGGMDLNLGANEIIMYSPQITVIAEVIMTFILVFVYLEVASQQRTQSMSGLIVGVALIALYICGYYISGPSLNPFRSFAPALFTGDVYLMDVWVFLVAPLIGGGLAGLAQPWFSKE